MKISNEISKTALITLAARVSASKHEKPILDDPVGNELLDAVSSNLPQDKMQRILSRGIPIALASHLALRARHYDRCARQFLNAHKNGLIVSLGAGFDTRYWRISEPEGRYVEVDLPEVVEVKRRLLKERVVFEMIGDSVLEDAWLERIATMQRSNILFLAEGLLMYLRPQDVKTLFSKLDTCFSVSEFVFEVVNEKYTRGIFKKVVQSKMRRRLGTTAGEAYRFGVRSARDVEAFGNNIAVLDEWSYFEDPDIRPRFLRWFRHIESISKTQWTVRASIGVS